ncbi:hypothetical protein GGG16DRAFT_113898 [Schizophyllum commune]
MSMPSRNFTIDNVSPLIRYDPKEKWKPGSTKEDPQADRYYRSTSTTTVLADATATFHFNGTDIYVYGAKRFNHRLYTVDLDGAAKTYDGHPRSGEDEFQDVLYSANDLDPETPHTIIVSCEQNSYLDIDYITWTNSIGNETTIQESDDAFAYSGEWLHAEDTANSMLYGNGVGHQTQDEDGYVNLTFAGSAISLYGVVGDGLGVYSVQLDESDIVFFNATNWGDTQGQAMLYHASSLDDGQHSLVVSNAPDHLSFDNLTIDYAIVYAKGREGGSRSLDRASEPVPVQVASETLWDGRVSIDGRADDLDPPPAPPDYEQAMQTMPRQ